MVTAVKKDTGSFVYMRLKKHNCPDCGGKLGVTKRKKTVKAGSAEAKAFDFSVGDIDLGGKVKFIWYEFKCKSCGHLFTEAKMKEIEKKLKEEKKREKQTK